MVGNFASFPLLYHCCSQTVFCDIYFLFNFFFFLQDAESSENLEKQKRFTRADGKVSEDLPFQWRILKYRVQRRL